MIRILRLVLLLCVLLPAARAEMLELRQAYVTTTVDAVLHERETSLPYNWDRHHGSRPGTAVFEIPLELEQPPSEPYAAYFSRVGNRAEVWLNGVLVSRFGDLSRPDQEDYAKAPQYVLIPAQLLQRDNLFRVLLSADGGRRGGLSTLLIGPETEVREHYNAVYRWQVNGSIAVAVFSLVVGVIALLLWLTQVELVSGGLPQRAALYLSAGLAEFCWMLRLSNTAMTHPPLPWPWWGVVQTVAYAGWFCGAALFCHYVAGWHRHPSMRWVRYAVGAMLLTAGPAAWLALTLHQDVYLTGWYGFVSLLFIGYTVVYFWTAVRRPTTEHVLVAVAGVFNVAVGFRDWLVIRASDNYSEISWMRYSSVLFGLALGYIVVTRFREATAPGAGPDGQHGGAGAAKGAGAGGELPAAGATGARAGARGRAHAHSARHARRCGLAHQRGHPPAAVGQGAARKTCCRRCATRWTSSSSRSMR